MDAYALSGIAQGLSDGLDKRRRTLIEDEDRAEAKTERADRRARRALVEGREDEAYSYDKSQRPLREESLRASVDAQKTGAKSAARNLEWAEQDRPLVQKERRLGVETREVGLEGELQRQKIQGNQESRAQTAFDQQQQEALQQAKDEGFDRFLDALEDGADPNYALSQFNSKGKAGIRPGTLKYDRQTGRIQFQGTIGGKVENVDTDLRTLRAALPREMRQQKGAVKVGKDDRLVIPQADGSFKEVLSPSGGGAGGPRGPKFNRQQWIRDAEDSVHQLLGSKAFDSVTQEFVFDESKRDVATLGSSFVGVIARRLDEEGLDAEPGEIARIAADAARRVKGSDSIMQEIAADPKNRGKTKKEITELATQRVRDSKIAARNALELELKEYARQRQQQRAVDEATPDAEPSDEIEDDAVQGGAPPVNLLREGYVQQFRDGSAWTLKNGKPQRVN